VAGSFDFILFGKKQVRLQCQQSIGSGMAQD